VQVADRILRKNPKHLTFLAPVITYLMTIMAGTGHTAFSMMPVITEVAKENDIRPARPLTIAVVASQIAITASPISAAVVFFSGELEGRGVDYIQLLAVVIPSTFIACMLTAGIMMAADKIRGVPDLHQDPEYRRRLDEGLVTPPQRHVQSELPAGAKRSVMIFLAGLVSVMTYATIISPKLGLVEEPVMGRDAAIISIMLTVGTAIVGFCKIKTDDILTSSVFRSGMSAAICVLGVAWLGTTFVTAHQEDITTWAGDLLNSYSWLLAVVLFFAAALLYSQAATTRALMPLALSI